MQFKNFLFSEVSLSLKDLNKTIQIMEKYRLKPRDAIIFRIMQKLRIPNIATFDSDYKHVDGLFCF